MKLIVALIIVHNQGTLNTTLISLDKFCYIKTGINEIPPSIILIIRHSRNRFKIILIVLKRTVIRKFFIFMSLKFLRRS